MERRGFVEAKVFGKKKYKKNSDICFVELENNFGVIPNPGQFITIQPLHQLSVMPRPFSVVTADEDSIMIAIKKVGKNTAIYHGLDAEDNIKVSGPHGKPFRSTNAKKYILVAGGIGAAGLLYIATNLKDNKKSVNVLLGAKTNEEIFADDLFKKEIDADGLRVITEAGKNGGTVVDLLKKVLKNDKSKSTIIACGPNPMLRATSEIAEKYGNKCFVSMEEIMACGGSGACWGCTIPMKKGAPKRLCQDGPVFDASIVDFDKIKNIHSFVSLAKVSKKAKKPMEIRLPTRDGKEIILPSPILTSSGCFDITNAEKNDLAHLGAIVVKGISLRPAYGNPAPRVCETPSGMMNAVGLQNPGLDVFIKKYLPRWLALGKLIIVNIYGESIEEFVEIAKRLFDAGVEIIEVNVSCPNKKGGGMQFGVKGIDTSNIVSAIRAEVPKIRIITKLTPNVTDIREIVHAAALSGTDMISLINTIQAMAIDINTRRPKIVGIGGMGGLSGPAIKPIGVRFVRQAYQYLSSIEKFSKIPILGMGGISEWEDAPEYIIAGASAVAIGTGSFSNKNATTEIFNGLNQWRKNQGANHILDPMGDVVLD